MTVESYIKENIGNTVCFNPEDEGKLLGLPLPYSVPTVGETFHAMFYWDTYFTDLALLALGDTAQVKNNLLNFAALIDRLGFIPNGNKTSLNDRSQPPFFALMAEKYYEATGDREALAELYPALVREHKFWVTERVCVNGLCHYGTAVLPDREEKYARTYASRIGEEYTEAKRQKLAENFLAQAESGWDFNARFEFDSINYCPADLNALVWSLEDRLAKFSAILGLDGSKWRKLADKRAAKMREFLLRDGIFTDRNAVTGKFSAYTSAASFYPLFVGMATEAEAHAARSLLPKLLHAHGIVPVEAITGGNPYQWGAPNGWPCLQVITAMGFSNYSMTDEAKTIADRYVNMVESVFAETGALWEKYNLDTGRSDAVNEYEMPEMLGWTAGAYLYLSETLASL